MERSTSHGGKRHGNKGKRHVQHATQTTVGRKHGSCSGPTRWNTPPHSTPCGGGSGGTLANTCMGIRSSRIHTNACEKTQEERLGTIEHAFEGEGRRETNHLAVAEKTEPRQPVEWTTLFLATTAVMWMGTCHASHALTIPGIVGDSELREGFVSGLALIFFSEIGDKTFFIAVLLALKANKTLVFSGTFGALAVMTVISVVLGRALHSVDEAFPILNNTKLPLDDILAVILLVVFGVQTLLSANEGNAKEEEEEAGAVVSALKLGENMALVLSTFALVFAAEWGDKSFIATIALAAASNPVGVASGAILGHAAATGIAVAGGSVLSDYVSERAVAYVGGSLFLVFAAATLIDILV